MSFILQAPYPQLGVTSIMPNPQFNDSRSLPVKVKPRYMIDGTRFTYVQTSNDQKLHFTWLLTRGKAEEFKQFVLAFMDSKIQITTHLGEVWLGYIMINPFEAVSAQPALGVMRETVNVTIEFRGQLVTSVVLECD